MGITFYYPCRACGGDGKRDIITLEGPQVEDPCYLCGGTGKIIPVNRGMDSTLIDQIIVELSYLRTKVDEIYNKVKDK